MKIEVRLSAGLLTMGVLVNFINATRRCIGSAQWAQVA